MTCDPQLTQAEREAGFQQNPPVARAIRPLPAFQIPKELQSHPLALELKRLADYINRDLLPVLQPTRARINESYPAVQRNAPSGNPLTYVMDSSTAASCPAAGFARFNASPQNTSTIVRLSNQNQLKQDTTPWTDLMANSATVPLGVVTISDAFAPQNYIRADVNSVTPGASCAEVGITPFEGSSTSPIGADRQVVVSFIPGVAGASVPVLAPGATPTWAQTLAVGNGSGGSQPTIINSDSLLFAAGSLGIEATTDLAVNVTDALTLESGTDMHLHATGQLHLGHETLTASIHQGALGAIEVVTSDAYSVSATGNASITAGGNVPVTAGGFFSIQTNASTRIVIDSTGAWNLDGTTPGTAGQYLRSGGTGAEPTWASLAFTELPAIASDTFLGNISGASAVPVAVNLSSIDSASIIYDATSHTFQRAALTGDVTAVQNGNSTVISANAVTNAKMATMLTDTFKANVSGVTATPSDVPLSTLAGAGLVFGTHTLDVTAGAGGSIVVGANDVQRGALTGAVSASQDSNATLFAGIRLNTSAQTARAALDFTSSTSITAVLTDTGSVLQPGFQRAALTGDVTASANSNSTTIANSAVTNAKMANMATDTFKGNVSGSTGAPSDVGLSTLAGTSISFSSHALSWDGVNARHGGTVVSTRRGLNFIDGSNVTLTVSDNSANDRVDVTIAASSSLPSVSSDTFLGNISGSTATAASVALASIASTSIPFNASHTFQRAALTGEVTASQNSNATTIDKTISPTWTGTHTFSGQVNLGNKVVFNGVASASFSTSQNNLNPTGWGAASKVRLTATTTGLSITGFQAGTTDGEFKWLINPSGSNTITIAHNSTSSTTTNRILCPNGTNFGWLPDNGIGIMYDTTDSRWYIVTGA